MIADSTIFITGGAGFIGSMLVERFVKHNHVIVFDNMSRDALSSKSFASHKNLLVVRGDVEDYESVRQAMSGAEYIIHCAGIAGIDTVIKCPTKTMSVNIFGSHNVMRAATALKNCQRVICFSTSEVFGSHAMSSKETDLSVIGAAGHARWTYAVSKLAEEHLALAFHAEFGLPTSVVRPFNIYGPGQVGEGAIKNFLMQALRNEPLTIYGDGAQIRAWCYVDDMVDGVIAVMEQEAAIGESFNIGNARSVVTIYGLANTIVRATKSTSEIVFAPPLSADIELRIPCVEKARNVLGFEAKVDLEEGLKATAEWYARQL